VTFLFSADQSFSLQVGQVVAYGYGINADFTRQLVDGGAWMMKQRLKDSFTSTFHNFFQVVNWSISVSIWIVNIIDNYDKYRQVD
jgi:roadblock/LC7 domain-containing protein